jgi:hypothetical protein
LVIGNLESLKAESEMENGMEPLVSLDHFRAIIWSLGGNSEAYDVELLYKRYLALMEGTEEDLEKATRTIEVNHAVGTHRGFN